MRSNFCRLPTFAWKGSSVPRETWKSTSIISRWRVRSGEFIYTERKRERERESEQRGFNYYARSRPENDRHEISASCKNDDNRGRLIIRVCRQAANFVEKGRWLVWRGANELWIPCARSYEFLRRSVRVCSGILRVDGASRAWIALLSLRETRFVRRLAISMDRTRYKVHVERANGFCCMLDVTRITRLTGW